jgi:histidinol-phosphatase
MAAVDFRAFIDELATISGDAIRPFFRTSLGVEDKSRGGAFDPVTAADRAAEAAMRAMIRNQFPAHGIIGEEFGAERADAELVWVLDPIDGTKSFISGVPLFGTLIALVERGVPVLGVIDQPISRERWVGARGLRSTLNGAPISTRACPALGSATLFATTPDMFRAADADAFQRLKSAVKLARFGGDCYAYGLLAAGFIDLVVEASLKPYDFAALVPVIAGAGGSMTDWRGGPLGLASEGRVLACGDPRLADAARGLLA